MSKNAVPVANDLVDKFFRLRYEKVQASAENIFRYEMRIESDTLTIAIDDLKQGRRLRRNKAVDSRLIEGIRDSLNDQQIFSLPAKIDGKSKDIWDSWTIHVVLNGQVHTVEVLNRIPPDNFKRICQVLENFGETELGMVSSSLSGDDLIKRAKESHQRSRKLYDERAVNPENLFNSIKACNETIWYLDTLEPKPAIYAEAIHNKQVAVDELDQQVEDHKFRATRSIQLQEWRKARDELLTILQKVPDPSDKRYMEAKVRLLDVEKRLQVP